MDSSFVDLDILLTKVRNPQSRTYFLDAVRAYKAGALRAALTAAWVAIAYDLIAKYRELSAMGDAAATAFLQSWDNATAINDIRQLLQLEGRILEDAADNTQAISQIAGRQLERLREDRHLCAHPAFSAEALLFEPTPELVRMHLVNAVDLVLGQEALQGRAIFEVFDGDVQSSGFPADHTRILDYVEQRYLARVRPQNIRNFGTVLAKSLLKGVPAHLDVVRSKVESALVAVRDRAPGAWPDVVPAIVRLLDTLDPADRPRAIAFIAAFPAFWPLMQEPTRTSLQETVNNANAANLTDYLVLRGVAFAPFRAPILALIAGLDRESLARAIAAAPLPELWPQAVELYAQSGSFRGSEANFDAYITPYTGSLDAAALDQVLDAVAANGQNYAAGGTSTLLLSQVRNAGNGRLPSADARNRFYQMLLRTRRREAFGEVTALFEADGWVPPPREADEDD
ncbi:hypothetical protein [Brevundimonas aurantiaca]|uniref:hypothetical protein n=1 Tax=Brevundimonas aurantiaca TaxID=74316 RepID=UPI0016025D6B|nr:hypothetical protein [Pseudomonas sp. FW305-3-2-15-E-TSA4]